MNNDFVPYTRHGWVLCSIEPGQKGPRRRGWNKRENAVKPERAKFLQAAGLCHAYSGTASVDIDNYDMAAAWLEERGVDLDALRLAPDAVQIISGQANRGKLIYALPDPLPSVKLAEGALELRCATRNNTTVQDVLPPSPHPSGETYRWAGNWRNLPPLPESLRAIWLEAIGPRELPDAPEPSADMGELADLIAARDADCGYDEWVRVGMALHHETKGSQDGLALWNEWSARGAKYPGFAQLQTHWTSFGNAEHPVTAGWLRASQVASPEDFDLLPAVPPSKVTPIEGGTSVKIELVAPIMDNPTEDNVAQLFEHCFKDRLRHCLAWKRWLVWSGSRWEEERTGLAIDYCRRLARTVNPKNKATLGRHGFARGVENHVRSARCFATEPHEWDQDSLLLNTPSVTVDLRTGDSRPHEQSDYITKSTRVSPAPGPMPYFERFLRDITHGDEDLIAYHQRSLGACLSGAVDDHFLLFWYGQGRNGKNTLGDLICWILGDYAKVIPTETLMTSKQPQHLTELANLRGLRLAVSSEVPAGASWNESRIKSVTGDQMISARYMRGDHFEFTRTHKHLIFGNHRPVLRVVDVGLRERLHIVPFRAEFTGSRCDPQMGNRLLAEAPQILSWLIDGHKKWIKDGQRLSKCDAVLEATTEYFDSQDMNELWLADRCVLDDKAETKSSELFGDYKSWMATRGEAPASGRRWGEFMGSRFRKRKSGSPIYQGVRLRPDETFEEFCGNSTSCGLDQLDQPTATAASEVLVPDGM